MVLATIRHVRRVPYLLAFIVAYVIYNDGVSIVDRPPNPCPKSSLAIYPGVVLELAKHHPRGRTMAFWIVARRRAECGTLVAMPVDTADEIRISCLACGNQITTRLKAGEATVTCGLCGTVFDLTALWEMVAETVRALLAQATTHGTAAPLLAESSQRTLDGLRELPEVLRMFANVVNSLLSERWRTH